MWEAQPWCRILQSNYLNQDAKSWQDVVSRESSTVPPLCIGAFNFLQLEIFDHFPEVEGVPSSTDSTDVLQSVGLLGDVNLEVEGLAV